MKTFRSLRLLAFLLALTILTAFAAVSLAENPTPTGEGTVIVSDKPIEEVVGQEGKAEPFVPDGTDKTVFYDDGRITVADTSAYPYSAIAYMVCWGDCECDWTGTGFMVGSDQLLTAAHCLICPTHGKWAKRIDFYFGFRNSRNYKLKYSGSWSALVGNGFDNHEYSVHGDYGCVKLRERIGDQVGWFGTWRDLSDTQLASQYVYVAGYKDGELKYDSGTVSPSTWEHMAYKIDTLPGTSGCPIFTSDYFAIGINIAENSQTNLGYRLSQTVMDGFNQLD